MKIITLTLLAIVIVAVGYAVLGDDMFLVSNEPLATEGTRNYLNETKDLPIIKKAPEFTGLGTW